MAKETYYFSHDYDSTGDPKMQAMLGNYGGMGYGIFWRLVEMLHAEGNHKLCLKKYVFEAIAKQMLTDAEHVSTFVDDCINKFELFLSDGKCIWSNRVIKNIEKMDTVSESRSKAGRASAEKRRKEKELAKHLLTHVEHSLTNVNKIKENKIKESNILSNSLIPNMVFVFKKSYPDYPEDQDMDYPSCLQIAYKIARAKEWSKDSVLNGNMDEIVKIWGTIVDFSKTDNWFKTRSISDFNKEYQRLIQKMKGDTGENNSKQTKSDAPPLTKLK